MCPTFKKNTFLNILVAIILQHLLSNSRVEVVCILVCLFFFNYHFCGCITGFLFVFLFLVFCDLSFIDKWTVHVHFRDSWWYYNPCEGLSFLNLADGTVPDPITLIKVGTSLKLTAILIGLSRFYSYLIQGFQLRT